MRKELGVLLIEDDKGEVAVQLFAEVDSVRKAFGNLAGSPADKPSRATFIPLSYAEDGSLQASSVSSKMLPVIESVEDRPDGYVLGQGPVKFPKPETVS